MRFAIYFAWVPMGSSVFTMGSCRVILGSAALCRYLQWVPLGFLLGSCIFTAHLNGFLLGSCWVPKLCDAICSGFLLGSCWVPVFSQRISMGSSWVPVGFRSFVSLFAVGSGWVPAGFRSFVSLFAVGSSWVPAGFRGFVSLFAVGSCWVPVGFRMDAGQLFSVVLSRSAHCYLNLLRNAGSNIQIYWQAITQTTFLQTVKFSKLIRKTTGQSYP